MWLTTSSIGRKVIMSVTGLALILFLTFHGCMNVVSLFSASGYNWVCEMLGANWYAVAATAGLGTLVLLHFVYAFILTFQNRRARGNSRYAVVDRPQQVEWASQNMLVLGIIVALGMALHLYNFWAKMMFVELAHVGDEFYATDGYHGSNTRSPTPFMRCFTSCGSPPFGSTSPTVCGVPSTPSVPAAKRGSPVLNASAISIPPC